MWFGFLGVFVIVALTNGAPAKNNVALLIIPCVMAAMGYVVMKKLVLDLVDEVYDGGEFLVVRNRGREHRIPLTDIINVSFFAQNPMRITLRLSGPSATTPLGNQVSFSPEQRFKLSPFAKNDIAEDLIVRVDEARSKRAG